MNPKFKWNNNKKFINAILYSCDDIFGLIDYFATNIKNDAEFNKDELFQFDVPVELEGVSREICRPSEAWEDKQSYIRQAQKLANMFIDNYEKYKDPNFTDYSNFGPTYKTFFKN